MYLAREEGVVCLLLGKPCLKNAYPEYNAYWRQCRHMCWGLTVFLWLKCDCLSSFMFDSQWRWYNSVDDSLGHVIASPVVEL